MFRVPAKLSPGVRPSLIMTGSDACSMNSFVPAALLPGMLFPTWQWLYSSRLHQLTHLWTVSLIITCAASPGINIIGVKPTRYQTTSGHWLSSCMAAQTGKTGCIDTVTLLTICPLVGGMQSTTTFFEHEMRVTQLRAVLATQSLIMPWDAMLQRDWHQDTAM